VRCSAGQRPGPEGGGGHPETQTELTIEILLAPIPDLPRDGRDLVALLDQTRRPVHAHAGDVLVHTHAHLLPEQAAQLRLPAGQVLEP
jgi:hypothetical protein